MQPVVLLVDDDLDLLRGLVRALRHEPYQIYTARSAAEAIVVLKAHPVDVIVADEQMPGMSGSELLGWVARKCPEVARIMLTGRATTETAIRAINDAAVFRFFTKPCDCLELALAIAEAIGARKPVHTDAGSS